MELTVTEALILAIGSLGLGMVMLIRGGNWTIDSAIYIAKHFGISPLVVGFTIVAFGTSFPELLVSVSANFHGSPGIALGNVLGSNLANILLVIGSTAVVATIFAVPRALIRDLVMMILATALLAVLMVTGEEIGRAAGCAMVVVLILYVLWQYHMARRGEIPVEEIESSVFKTLPSSLVFLLAGLVFIALGAEFLVRGAKISATVIGVPEDVIGLSVIAVGTSLPELSTCLIAARRKQTDIILGNIIGSNVFNILMIIGITAFVKPIAMAGVSPQLVHFDIWLVLAVSVVFTLILLFYRKVNRFLGIAFVSSYILYIIGIYALL